MTRETISPYDRGFREFSAAYEAFGFADIHRGALPFLPEKPGLVLDVGAGSGRDAAWFAGKGWDVVAVEPALGMRMRAMQIHTSTRIRWIDDTLPALSAIYRHGLSFDLVWLSGVWMHVPPADRARAMRKLSMLIKPGGRLVLTLRHGPAPDDRPMWPVDAHEVERLGLDMGLALRVATDHADDLQGRPGVRWQTVILDMPDDGAGALPLLRGVILGQEKNATYKLALLRCMARIADSSPNAARDYPQHVELPLGLVALNWLRMFKPLIAADLPQRPDGRLGFVKDAFHGIGGIASFDLRLGMQFSGAEASAVRRAIADAARLIKDMPARHLTFADDKPVFEADFGRTPKPANTIRIEQDWLFEYGTIQVPLPVWHALLRMSAWIEPMLLTEWVRLTQRYAARSGKPVTTDAVLKALTWTDPVRDTHFVREIAQARLRRGDNVRCVWSGKPLHEGAFDIDHCLPWSAWPCGDLWNLLPAGRAINQRGKRDRIVAADALAAAKPMIMDWWRGAYWEDSPAMRARFSEEAQTTLPLPQGARFDLDEVFTALDFRRLRLRQDTQVPEWPGAARVDHA